MLTRMVRISKMSYLNIQNCSQCSFGCALDVMPSNFKVPQRGSCIKVWSVKCNGKCLKHMADASDCALAIYHLNRLTAYVTSLHRFCQVLKGADVVTLCQNECCGQLWVRHMFTTMWESKSF